MRPLIVVLPLICCVACGDGAVNAVQRAAIERVQAEPRTLPELPADCRRQRSAAVAEGDRLDMALLSLAAVNAAQRAQIRRCAAWYDDLRAGLAVGAR